MSSLVDLEERLRAVLARRPEVRFALLFGSAVKRGPDLARDIDVGVSLAVSPSLLELGRLEGELEHALGRAVDVVDLGRASTLLRREAARGGRVLLARDRAALLEFQARVPIEYFDLEPHRARQAAGLRRALGLTA